MFRKSRYIITLLLLTPLNLKAVNSEDSTSRVLTVFERRQREIFINHLDGLKAVIDSIIRSSKAHAYLMEKKSKHEIRREEMAPLQDYIQGGLDSDTISESIIDSPLQDIAKITKDLLRNKASHMDGIQSSIDALKLAKDRLDLAYQLEFEYVFQLYQDDNMRPSFQEELTKRGYHILQSVLDKLNSDVSNLKTELEVCKPVLGIHTHEETKITLKHPDLSSKSVEQILGTEYIEKLTSYFPLDSIDCLNFFLYK
jgi:hypothetical protein